MQSNDAEHANYQIIRSTIPIILAFALSQIAGLVQKMIATRAFGTGDAIDAYNTASSFPNLIFSLVAGGALTSALVPSFTALLVKGDHKSTWKLAWSIIHSVILLLTIISGISAFFAPDVAHLLAPDYSTEKLRITIQLLRILLLTSTVFGFSGIISAILNAHQHFFLPALASSFYWVGLILGLLFIVPAFGIFGLAWGAVLGSMLHLTVQLPGFLRLPRYKYFTGIGLNDPNTRQILVLMGPRLISVATVQINYIANTIIANLQGSGAVSAINWAFPIMTMPLVMIGQAIGFATLPTFSELVARGKLADMRHVLSFMLRSVVLLSIPATFGLIVLRQPVITLLYQGGEFTQNAVAQVAWALLWYAIGLTGHCTLEVLVRGFYALHNTRTPALVGTGAMILNVILSIIICSWFTSFGWMSFGGLALSNSLATSLESLVLIFIIRRQLNGLEDVEIIWTFVRSLISSLTMGIVIEAWLKYSQFSNKLFVVLVALILGSSIYVGSVLILRVREALLILNWIGKPFFRDAPGPGSEAK